MNKKISMMIVMLLLSLAGAWADDYDPPNPPDPLATFQLTVVTSPSEAGYVSGGGRFQKGVQVWISTSPRVSYDFQYWQCEGQRVSDSRSFYYTMPDKAVTLEAVYTFNPSSPADPTPSNKFKLYLEQNLEGSCTFNIVSGLKQIAGNSIYVSAQNVSAGYRFEGWFVGEEKVSDSRSFYYMMPYQDVTLTAHFFYDPDSPDDPSSDQSDIDNPDYIKGDVNGDGDVDIADAVCIVNYVVGKPTTSFNIHAAEVNDDGDIDIADAVRIVNFVVGKLPVLAPRIPE